MTATNLARTRAVLDLVLEHRKVQEARYGEANLDIVSGTGPEVRWLGPLTGRSATEIQKVLRRDYEDFEEETGAPTWLHLVREEICEAFELEDTDPKFAEELIQVAALCVSWLERIGVVRCESCSSLDGVHLVAGRRHCNDCLEEVVARG